MFYGGTRMFRFFTRKSNLCRTIYVGCQLVSPINTEEVEFLTSRKVKLAVEEVNGVGEPFPPKKVGERNSNTEGHERFIEF